MNNCGWVKNGGKCILEQENKEKSYTEEDLLLFIYDLRKQNIELKDNWNKLKEWLEEMIDYEEYDKIERDTFKKVLSKIQEIEGGTNV